MDDLCEKQVISETSVVITRKHQKLVPFREDRCIPNSAKHLR